MGMDDGQGNTCSSISKQFWIFHPKSDLIFKANVIFIEGRGEAQADLQADSTAEFVLLSEIPQDGMDKKENRRTGAVPLHTDSWCGRAETRK